jgi:hypothetical protein
MKFGWAVGVDSLVKEKVGSSGLDVGQLRCGLGGWDYLVM